MSSELGSEVSDVNERPEQAPERLSTVVMVESSGNPRSSPQRTAAHVRMKSVPDVISLPVSRPAGVAPPSRETHQGGSLSESWKSNPLYQNQLPVTLVKSDSIDTELQIRVVGTPERNDALVESRASPKLKTEDQRKADFRSSLLKRESSVDFREEWAASTKLSQQKSLGKWRDPVQVSSFGIKDAWEDGFNSASEKSASPTAHVSVSFGGRPIASSVELESLLDCDHDNDEMSVMKVGPALVSADANENLLNGHSWLKSTDFLKGSSDVVSRSNRAPTFEYS